MSRDTLPSAWLAPAMSLAFVLLQPGAVGATAPPQPPQSYVDTTYTPPAGLVHTVNAGGNLQAALDAALPGDIINLQAGATFTGPFTLPLKSGNGWIVVRTSAHDAACPPPGPGSVPPTPPCSPRSSPPIPAPRCGRQAGRASLPVHRRRVHRGYDRDHELRPRLPRRRLERPECPGRRSPPPHPGSRLHPWERHRQPASRRRPQQRLERGHRLLHLGRPRDRRRLPGHRGLERTRSLQDRQQLPVGSG